MTISREILDLHVRFFQKMWVCEVKRASVYSLVDANRAGLEMSTSTELFSTMETGDWNGKFLKIDAKTPTSLCIGTRRRTTTRISGRAWHTSAVNRAPRRLRTDFIGPIVRCSCELSCETKTWRSGFTSGNLLASEISRSDICCQLSWMLIRKRNSTKVWRYAVEKNTKERIHIAYWKENHSPNLFKYSCVYGEILIRPKISAKWRDSKCHVYNR